MTAPRSSPIFPWRFILLLACCLAAAPSIANAPAAAFEQANKLYELEKFPEAIQAYEQLLGDGIVSPAIYFNLGNACFKNGQPGKAILNYRLAEKLAPMDPDIRGNLQFVRKNLGDGQIRSSGWLQDLLRPFTLNGLTIAAMALAWTCLLLIFAAQLRPALKEKVRTAITVAAASAATLALALGLKYSLESRRAPGVIVAPEAVARYGPLEESQRAFTLPNGAEVLIQDQKDQWLQIQDPAGRLGWVRSEHLAKVQLPESSRSLRKPAD